MSNKVLFGLENVHVAFYDEDTATWGTPVAIPGAVNLALSPEGDQSIFYADNVAYHVVDTNNGYKGDLEMALVPDTVLADMFGWEVDDNDALIEIADGVPQPFALLFEVEGNDADKRYVFYHCTASRPKEEHKTKSDKAEPDTSTMTLTVAPIARAAGLIVKAVIELGAGNVSAYNAWFTAVTEPSGVVS